MTGRNVNKRDIAERQELVTQLYNELGGAKASTAGVQADCEASQSDEAIIAAIMREPAFAALAGGDISACGNDHSRADQALVNTIAARSGNRAQTERIWLGSQLGQRDKTQKRADYRKRTIERAFDRLTLASGPEGFTVNGQTVPRGSDPVAPSAAPIGDQSLLWDASQWEGREPAPQKEIVPGLFLAGHVNSLYGEGGSYKTLLTQLALSSVAFGVKFLDRCTMTGNGLMLNCEDDLNRLHKIQ